MKWKLEHLKKSPNNNFKDSFLRYFFKTTKKTDKISSKTHTNFFLTLKFSFFTFSMLHMHAHTYFFAFNICSLNQGNPHFTPATFSFTHICFLIYEIFLFFAATALLPLLLLPHMSVFAYLFYLFSCRN